MHFLFVCKQIYELHLRLYYCECFRQLALQLIFDMWLVKVSISAAYLRFRQSAHEWFR